MPGVAPKFPEQRRRRNAPERGEWVDLEPLEEPILGPFDRSFMTVRERMWNGWRNDPVTSQYGVSDIEAIYDLAAEWGDMGYADRDRRLNWLGLTPKGKRDLRWRTPNEVKTIKAQAAKASVHRLKAVGE
jgi:hypothetical protein